MMKNWSISLIVIIGSFSLFSFINAHKAPRPVNDFVVVLDAGHGGHDPGNLGNGYLEKDIALSIVLKAGAALEKIPGIKVIYTRDSDVFVDLFKRGEIANDQNADLFISVHCDSHNSDANGAGTFVLGLHANSQNFEVAKKENSVIYLEDNYEQKYSQYDINSPESVIGLTIMQEEYLEQSMQFAGMLQQNFTKNLNRKDRKVKQAGFIVLHQTFMPSVLVETGFLTNKNEGAYLNSQKGQEEMGRAIADAVIAYRKGVQPNAVTQPVVVEEPKKETPVTQAKTEPKKEAKPAVATASNTPKTGTTTTNVAHTVEFRVQLMASAKNIALTPQNFNGLDVLSKETFRSLNRYMYGKTGSYERAKELQAIASANGFTGCYIVAYKDGTRIPVEEAVKLASIR